jgi:hypothetical protein
MRVLEAAKPARVLTVSTLLALVCEVENCRFTMHGVACAAETVMSPSMFLPVLAWEVQELGRDLFEQDLGCTLKRDEGALFGARAVVPYVHGHVGANIRFLCFLHTATELFGLRPNASIEVAPLANALREHFQAFMSTQPANQGDISWPLPPVSRLN